jgi:hypothetical protein
MTATATKGKALAARKDKRPAKKTKKDPPPVERSPKARPPRRARGVAAPVKHTDLSLPVADGDPEGVSCTTAPAPIITRAQALRELAGRANRGNERALACLRQLLDSCPEIWQQVGDLARRAELAWLDLVAGDDQMSAESVRRKVARLKSDLAGPEPTPLEALLIDQIAVTWMAAMHGEIEAASVGGSVEQARYRQSRAESTQKRFLRAMKTLATLRAVAPRGLVPSSGRKSTMPDEEPG